MDAGAVGPWSFGTACQLLFDEREQRQPAPFGTCRGRCPRSALAPISATTSPAPYDHRNGRSRRCLCQRRLATCGCRDQVPAASRGRQTLLKTRAADSR
jgi:hypothetical protein